jgi:Zn-finger nucleic acid-binding protein
MICPRCILPLEARTFKSATIHGCRSCGGVWLDNAQTDTVFKRMPGAASVVKASEQAARSSAGDAVATDGMARCPSCREEMLLCEAEGVRIDQCEAHGTWFDARELRRIANAEVHRPTARTSAPRRNDVDDAKPDAGDWIEGFFDALSEFRWPK